MRTITLLKLSLTILLFIPLLAFGQNADESNTHQRQTIKLTAAEREAVLAEMRGFLESTEKIVKALSEGNMSLAVKAARASGLAAGANMPKTLGPKLPLEFRKLGSDTHRKFDGLALDAEELEDSGHSLAQLGVLLGNCVSCHATFRFVEE